MYKYEIVYVFFFLYFLFFENAYPCMQMTSTTLQRQNHARRRVLIRKALLQVGVQHVPESVHDGRVTVTAVLLHEQTFDIPRPRALVGLPWRRRAAHPPPAARVAALHHGVDAQEAAGQGPL